MVLKREEVHMSALMFTYICQYSAYFLFIFKINKPSKIWSFCYLATNNSINNNNNHHYHLHRHYRVHQQHRHLVISKGAHKLKILGVMSSFLAISSCSEYIPECEAQKKEGRGGVGGRSDQYGHLCACVCQQEASCSPGTPSLGKVCRCLAKWTCSLVLKWMTCKVA